MSSPKPGKSGDLCVKHVSDSGSSLKTEEKTERQCGQ